MPATYLKYTLGSLLLIFIANPALAADEATEVVKNNPAYISLGDPMVLNLKTTNRKLTFLQLKADVLVKDESSKALIEAHIPAIRHQLIVLLSEQPAMDLKTPAKRELIRQQATQEVRQMLESMADNKDVEEILFSSFLVQ